MTSHELAKLLLAGPDHTVMVCGYEFGFTEVRPALVYESVVDWQWWKEKGRRVMDELNNYDLQQHRTDCRRAHCEARRKRYEAVGVLVMAQPEFGYREHYWDILDAIAELLRKS